ncbi:MAG: DUF2062 domain-containing protein [Phycisphaeraceae bacterium]
MVHLRLIFPVHTSAKRIAFGVSLGMFAAFTPAIGFQMGLAWVLATVFNASRPAAMAAVWVTNPLTIGPAYALTYLVGRPFWFGSPDAGLLQLSLAIRGSEPSYGMDAIFTAFHNMYSLGPAMLIPLFIGGAITGLAAGFFSYYPTRWAVTWWQKRRWRKRASHQRKSRARSMANKGENTIDPHKGELRKAA